tara:strand:- start:226 stop:579 length:354 start_codon:yes stop_codon:yes gene_type:complete
MKKKFYNTGEFKHSASFQATSTTSDGAGGFTNTYQTKHTARCSITPQQANEKIQGGQVVGNTVYNIVVSDNSNFDPQLDNNYKINVASGIYQGAYNIKEVLLMDGPVRRYHIKATKK